MRIHMIDTSGGMAAPTLDRIRAHLKKGDLAACFDTQVHNVQTIDDPSDYKMRAMGGTMFKPVADFVYKTASDPSQVTVYGDMVFMDDLVGMVRAGMRENPHVKWDFVVTEDSGEIPMVKTVVAELRALGCAVSFLNMITLWLHAE